MSIREPRNKERRSLRAVMQGGVPRGKKRKTRMKKSFVKTLPWKHWLHTHYTDTHTDTHTHTSAGTTTHPGMEPLMLYSVATVKKEEVFAE